MSWSLSYATDRVVQIPSKCLALSWYLIVLIVFLYIGGYAIIWTKGYQQSSSLESVVVTKVKGVLHTNAFSERDLDVSNPSFYRRVWDANDIVIPAHGGENGGFFILTNVVITPNQTRSTCSEDESVEGAICTSDSQCHRGQSLRIGNGFMTGRCVAREQTAGVKTCEVEAWCPVEHHKLPLGGQRALLVDTQDFTVLIKNSIEFPAFGPKFKRRNILESANFTKDYLQKCIYDKMKDPFCPTFRLRDIVTGASETYAQVAKTGAVFAIQIKWNCDFDWGRSINDCLPVYSFARMDNPNAALSPGFNFRSTVYHEENRRTLTQNFGLKFLIKVEGEGKMFDSVKFVLAVGASIGLFALATVICDLAFKVLCVLKNWVDWEWLRVYNEDMKFDWSYVRGRTPVIPLRKEQEPLRI